jgi:MSHA biogenesis protein MshN
MSVINQLLIDLEKRRASGAERSVLPNHVRAMPNEQPPARWPWIAAGGAAAVAATVVAGILLSGIHWTGERAAAAPMPARGAEVAIEREVAASAGVVIAAKDDDIAASLKDAAASRLSFELSNPPAVPEPVAASTPVPTERVVVSRAAPPPSAGSETPAPAAARAGPVKSAPVVAQAGAHTGKAEIHKEVRQPTPRELAEIEFRKATALLHQSRMAEAQEGFQAALAAYPAHHGARQGLVGILLDARKFADAERVLADGLALSPGQTGFAMTLARLQVDRGEGALAVATLRRGLDQSQGSADYVAFLAALLQRQGRHDEAIEQFQAALRIRPVAGVWWLGLGISLQAVNRPADAQEAYARARATNLSPELAAFAEQRIKQLQ